MKLYVCLFCGHNAKAGDHTYCKQQLFRMAEDMKHEEAWLVVQKAENGFYGSATNADTFARLGDKEYTHKQKEMSIDITSLEASNKRYKG